jgi:prepilin-type processing-associated H-X9-DG protein
MSPRRALLAVLLLLILLLAAASLPRHCRTAARRQSSCQANLAEIARACKQYAADHNDLLPGYEGGVVSDLRNYAEVRQAMAHPLQALSGYFPPEVEPVWTCPASPSIASRTGSSYLFAGFGTRGVEPLSAYDPALIPVAWDLTPSHPGRTRDVAFLDGHVEPFPAADTVLVSPRKPWAGRSGIDLRKGQTIDLSAGGQWIYNYATPSSDIMPPVGIGREDEEWLCPKLPRCALVARVGDGEPFLVGYGGTFLANASGELAFSINESVKERRYFDDNRGLMWVFVRR